ncbi:MAG: hypothetical protein ACRC20_08015 [Segniliparus sp.]|uniref:hypothetical protein n=1 Tax=Segniliparus sp. TaxID=2804064 RepID=UPI003F35E223
MESSGAAREGHYSYPALGAVGTDSRERGPSEPPPGMPEPAAAPPASAAWRPGPAPDEAARAVADAIVRAALARKPSAGVRMPLQPGAIPLRPLSLSEIYNGAVAVVRSNPKTVLGFSVVVLAVGALVQIAVLAPVLRWALRATGAFGSAVALDSPESRSTVSLAGSLADAPVSLVAATLIAGCVMPVLARALAGERGEPEPARAAWLETRARALPLACLSCVVLFVQALIVLLPVVAALLVIAIGFSVPGAVLLLVLVEPFFLLLASVVGVFLSLSAPAMMSERLGVLASCRRSALLVQRGFWKILGVGLLTKLVTAFVGLSLSLPFMVAGEAFGSDTTPDGHVAVLSVVLLAVGQLLSRSVLMPFAASVTALLYVDQRMRQEAYDLVLLGSLGGGVVDAGRIGQEA